MFSVYDLRTLRVHSVPEAAQPGESIQHPPFGSAPAHSDEFSELAHKLAERVMVLYELG